jgi:hypothetical protein
MHALSLISSRKFKTLTATPTPERPPLRLPFASPRSLQQSSNSHIMVDQNFPEGADRMVIIKGQRDSVDRAAAMINELIAGEPGSASAIIAKVCVAVCRGCEGCCEGFAGFGGCFSLGFARAHRSDDQRTHRGRAGQRLCHHRQGVFV